MDEYAVDLVAVGLQTGHRGQVWSVSANAASRAPVRHRGACTLAR